MLRLVTGASASGKSEYAENLALRLGERRIYVATMQIWDEEDAIRAARHKRQRAGKGFATLERSADLEHLSLPDPGRRPAADVILLECLTHLAVNEFYREEAGAKRRILNGIRHLEAQCGTLIVVTGEIGCDGIRYDEESERYRRLLGDLNRSLAARAASVTEVVCGIALPVRRAAGIKN